MADEPTLGEVLRRLEQVASELAKVTEQLRTDRVEAAATYVRKDVYIAETTSVTVRVGKLEDDNEAKEKDAAAFRRQLLFMILGIAIPAIGGLLLAINNFLSAGGTP